MLSAHNDVINILMSAQNTQKYLELDSRCAVKESTYGN